VTTLDQDANAALAITRPRERRVAGWRIDWFNVFGLSSYHVLGVLAFTPWFFSWYGLAFAILAHFTIGLLGVSVCYHRLLTHRAFRCPRWLEYSLALMGVCCSMDSPAWWVATHRLHHQYTDDLDGDPHTPIKSLYWAHMGWLFYKNDRTDREAVTQRYAREMMRQPFYAWLERYWKGIITVCWAVALTSGFVTGKLSGLSTADSVMTAATFLLWGVIVRTLVTWHAIWAINSVAHSWGYRNYDTREGSRNNFVIGLLANGEGWHNNHHADPNSAMHGHRWWEFDLAWCVIRLLAALGLAKDIVLPAPRRRFGESVD
jgi:fatty-acid desaturase